jgi:hypothetical protein
MSWAQNPSASPRYGAATAVSAMTNTQLNTYLFSDVTLGVANKGMLSGLIHRIADGRILDDQDYGNKQFIIAKLGIGQV